MKLQCGHGWHAFLLLGLASHSSDNGPRHSQSSQLSQSIRTSKLQASYVRTDSVHAVTRCQRGYRMLLLSSELLARYASAPCEAWALWRGTITRCVRQLHQIRGMRCAASRVHDRLSLVAPKRIPEQDTRLFSRMTLLSVDI